MAAPSPSGDEFIWKSDMKTKLKVIQNLIVALACLVTSCADAQFAIDWFAIDGSGGTSTGGEYSLSGSTGQADAAVTMTGGDYAMDGGFWSNPAADTSPSGLFERNLISNPDAEAGAGSVSGFDVVPVPNWTSSGNITVTVYGTASALPWPGLLFGTNVFTGGPNNSSSSATQIIDVSAGAAEVDSGTVQSELSGWFGGFASQDDRASLIATFLNASSNALATTTIGNVLALDRTNVTTALYRATNNIVPVGTRTIQLMLVITRDAGSYNDGSADHLSLILHLPVSSLRITAVERIGNDLRLSVTSVLGHNYVIQRCGDLSSGTWTTLPETAFSGNGGTLQQTITNAHIEPKQFYRVQQQ